MPLGIIAAFGHNISFQAASHVYRHFGYVLAITRLRQEMRSHLSKEQGTDLAEIAETTGLRPA